VESSTDYLRKQNAVLLKSEIRDDDTRGLEFARQRGFHIERHTYESVLDLDPFDKRPYLPAVAALEDQGIRFCSLADFPNTPEMQSAYNLHTGVRHAYRGRKIAQALKIKAALYARQHKMRFLRTNNDSLNAPILSINRKMGYQPQPGKRVLQHPGMRLQFTAVCTLN
jgi:GNAT superfamily N-acetyltransferase